MRAVDLIRRKRDGGRLEPSEWTWLIEGLLSGAVPRYQWSALLMAIVWQGLDEEETLALTSSMLHSGQVIDLSDLPGPKIDKHSTGGVGDKTSLVLAPIAAACGVLVPMVSGRGLGHTGGTLDKLAAIPGFRVDLDLKRYREVLVARGLVLIGQTDELAPADRLLYALRDATGTVESLPLITSSILAKKLAEGIDGLVLDVKVGDGAFLPGIDQARALAHALCSITRGMGKRAVALITSMDQPLGQAVGNAIEVAEAIACLRGQGPEDLASLSVELAAEMVLMGGIEPDLTHARLRCQRTLADGSALERFRAMVGAQGGNPAVVDEPERVLPQAPWSEPVRAPRAGHVQRLAARRIGHAAMLLGAGRAAAEHSIDAAAGVRVHYKVGAEVGAGDVVFTMLGQHEGPHRKHALHHLREALVIGDEPVAAVPLIRERIAEPGGPSA